MGFYVTPSFFPEVPKREKGREPSVAPGLSFFARKPLAVSPKFCFLPPLWK